MCQRAIYSQYGDHKFDFLVISPVCMNSGLCSSFFPVRSNYLSSGKMGGLKWHNNICDGNLKNECFCDYLQGRYWRTVCSLCCAKIIGSKNLAFIHRRGMEHVLIPTLTTAYQEDRWRNKFTNTPQNIRFFSKISLLHVDFLLHSLVTLEMCLRSLHCNILCWTEQCLCEQMRVGPATWGFSIWCQVVWGEKSSVLTHFIPSHPSFLLWKRIFESIVSVWDFQTKKYRNGRKKIYAFKC